MGQQAHEKSKRKEGQQAMTLTIDRWTNVQPTRACDPLLDEMQQAGRQALTETDPQRVAFFTGLFTGYAVGFGLVTREALDRARDQPGASAVHIDFRRPLFDDDENTLWACGVRHGYWLATSELPNIDECVLCGERLVEDLDAADGCTDGQFCELDDHRREWHNAAGSFATCWDDQPADRWEDR